MTRSDLRFGDLVLLSNGMRAIYMGLWADIYLDDDERERLADKHDTVYPYTVVYEDTVKQMSNLLNLNLNDTEQKRGFYHSLLNRFSLHDFVDDYDIEEIVESDPNL